jgi:anti-sigma regulatory factor (Ser/Thr protein kinase)
VTDDHSNNRTDVTDPLTAIWSSVVGSIGDIGCARSELSAELQLVGCSHRLVDDVALIVTELGVNAFEHGRAGHVEVRVDAGADGTIEIRVSHREDLAGFDVAAVPAMAAADELAGRGRAIVAGLATRFETDRVAPDRIEQLAVVAP